MIALITGASSGIGAATARRLARVLMRRAIGGARV
jgi:NADP-dependent 3-hydroxy acid dehydrogenase YdfG